MDGIGQWTRTVWPAIAAMFVGGCIFGSGGGGTPGADAGGDGADTGSVVADGGETSETDADGSAGCTTDDQCDNRDRVVHVCEGGSCRPDGCEKGWEDVDGNADNGCECDTDRKETYLKDADGDDHPGTTEKTFCGPPESDDWVAKLGAPDRDCDDEAPGVHPGVPDGENWRCDQADNDCDDTVDDVCCGASDAEAGPPEPVRIGGDADQSDAVIVPAVDEAPEAAAYLVGWRQDDSVRLQHVDRAGDPVSSGGPNSIEVDAGVRDFAVAAQSFVSESGSGYIVAVAGGNGTLVVRAFGANLAESNSDAWPMQLYRTPHPELAIDHVSMFVDSDQRRIGLAFSEESGETDEGHHVVAMLVTIPEDLESESPYIERYADALDPDADDDQNPALVEKAAAPEIAVVDGTPTTVWWNADAETIYGVRLADGDASGAFSVPVGLETSTAADESVALLGIGTGAHLLYPDYREDSPRVLRHLAVGADETGALGPGTQVTGEAKLDRQPSATPVDRDGDGEADHLLVTWARGAADDPEIAAGRIPFGGEEGADPMEPEIVKESGDGATSPEVAARDDRGGVIWRQPKSAGVDSHVEYAPLSIDGVPICN